MTALRLTAAALQRFLDASEPDLGARVTIVTPVSGGYSRDTAIGEVIWADGSTGKVVLRGDPPEGTGVFMSQRDPEWQLLRALATTGPCRLPAARWFDEKGEFFGTKCIVSEFYDSRSLQDLARDAEAGHGDMSEVLDTFVDAVVDIHNTPLDDLPAQMPRPLDWDTYIDGLIDMLDGFSRSGRDSRPALRYAAARLRSYRPPAVPLALVHGDCQPGNFLLGEAGTLVIDWEFARIGDPREDIGYYTRMPVLPNLFDADPEGFLARYRQRSGMTEEQLNPQVADFFFLLGLTRLYGQELDAADAVANGQHRGVMAPYLLSAISNSFNDYYQIARRLGTS